MANENDPKATSSDDDAPNGNEDRAAEGEAAKEEAPEAAPSKEASKEALKEASKEASTEDAAAADASDAAGESDAKAPEAAKASEPIKPIAPTPIKGAAWANGIAGFEARWTWFESRLLTFVLLWQLLSLVSWVLLTGISAPPSTGDSSGTAFRSVIAALILSVGAWFGFKKLPLERRRALVIASIALGVVIGLVLRPPDGATSGIRFTVNRALSLDRLDAHLVSYFSNIKGWLQEGSTLTLMGGLRGLATRLTLWLALLGASLATAAGKHIHIDVIFRFLPKRLRVPAAIINFCAAAAVCFAGAWGFVDHLAIENFDAKADDTAGAKISQIATRMGEHFFLTRKQIGLDLRSLPRVLSGGRYDVWMTAPMWNEWVKDAGFESHYKPEEIQTILVPEDSAPHPPLVLAPSGEATRGVLVNDLNLVFPFGLLVIGLRFLLRAILTLSGHIPVDPDAAHKHEGAEGEGAKAQASSTGGV